MENESTEATTVLCAAGCGHAAYFDEMTPDEIAYALTFAGWEKGVCPECVKMGLQANRLAAVDAIAKEVFACDEVE